MFKATIELFQNDVMIFGFIVQGTGASDRVAALNCATNLAFLEEALEPQPKERHSITTLLSVIYKIH